LVSLDALHTQDETARTVVLVCRCPLFRGGRNATVTS